MKRSILLMVFCMLLAAVTQQSRAQGESPPLPTPIELAITIPTQTQTLPASVEPDAETPAPMPTPAPGIEHLRVLMPAIYQLPLVGGYAADRPIVWDRGIVHFYLPPGSDSKEIEAVRYISFPKGVPPLVLYSKITDGWSPSRSITFTRRGSKYGCAERPNLQLVIVGRPTR